MKRELERIEIPGEHDARLRAWEVVQAAYAERERVPRRRRVPVRLLAVAAAAAAVVAAIVSPPGRALLDDVREAIGVEEAAPALFDLPDAGRLLVQSDEGPWIVQPDGSKRLLGRYDEASWSPRDLFVVVTRANELIAVDPKGTIRWSLARPHVRLPRWAPSGFRIAYLSGSLLRVVAGDGTGDRPFGDAVAAVAPAWRPEPRHVLAFVARTGEVNLYNTDRRALYWRSRPIPGMRELVWSRDGSRLAAVSDDRLTIFAWNRRRPLTVRRVSGLVAAAYGPGGRLAVLRRGEVMVDGRRVFAGAGPFTGVAWSPDGRWLLVEWRDASQWIFISVEGKRKIEAVSGISTQFESSQFPSVEGWCCASR